MTHSKTGWVCDVNKCPRNLPQNDFSYQVEKRYLTIAKIMFLTSALDGQEPEECAEAFASRIEEMTEEIVNFDLEVIPLNGGYIGHEIAGSHLIPKKLSKHKFRKQIFEEWDGSCAYCGKPADTLDHVIPKSKGGGMSIKNNLVSCCKFCNGSKSDRDWKEWFAEQSFWTQEKQDLISYWLANGSLD